MYEFENFQDMFGNDCDIKYLVDTVLLLKDRFAKKSILKREDMLGLGDCWANMACIDKLEQCGYITMVGDHEITNYKTYRNIRL